jgi:hypothetical protein
LKKQLNDYIEHLYGEEKTDPMYAPEVAQSRIDFRAGFEAGQPKWIKGIPPHNNEVIVKTQRSHHGSNIKTEIKQLAFYENDVWQTMERDNIEDHDWQVIEYIEIP